MGYCEIRKKDINIKNKSSHVKSTTHKENEVIFRVNNNLIDKTYTYLILKIDQVEGLLERAIDDFKQFFHRFKSKHVFVVKIFNEANGNISYFFIKQI